ncbi:MULTISPECIES: helix-turn-helix transcriptional regulator [Dickeya]|nr:MULTISPECIES: PAS domain-containing protein [Dickeya]
MSATLLPPSFEEAVFSLLSATLQALGSVMPANVEIVLHDLRTPEYSVVDIVNAHITGRKKGDAVLAGMRTDKGFLSVLEERQEPVSLLLDYPTFNRDGSPLRSSSIFYRNGHGRPFATLCINVDNAGIHHAISILQTLANTVAIPRQPGIEPAAPDAEPGRDNIEDLMRDIIDSATALSAGRSRADVKKANLLAVQNMQEKGLFLIKGSVEKAAAALGVTRFTIYNYLDELKNPRR